MLKLPPGYTLLAIPEAQVSQFAELLRKLTGGVTGGDGVEITQHPNGWQVGAEDVPQGSGASPSKFSAKVTGVENDYVLVELIGPDGTAISASFPAVKADQLRHGKLRDDATDRYPKIDTFVTVDENTATVTLDSTTYEWLVTPNGFRVGDPVVVQYLGSTGVTVNNELVAWLVDP
ncbi:MAG: hypothetical protein AAGF84_10780, partial [Planctomycetota bacterium]